MALCTESRIRVRYAETDSMGVVYYSNYLVWMEVGRTDYLARIGFPYSMVEQDGVLFPASEVGFRIFRPSRYEDELVVATRLDKLQSRKIVFGYEVTMDSELLVSGFTVHICVNERMKVRTVPQALYQALRDSMDGGGDGGGCG